MATFGGLQEMAQSITAFLRAHGGAFTTATNYGAPLDSPVSSTEAVRVTLLWVTPQPTHRNDAPFRNLAGQLEPPPLTLSAYLMFTTYGGDVDPATAYQLLGRILRIFHEEPVLQLPIDGVGEGELTLTLVPTAADLMEKVFSPIQLKHRPFAIYEAGPIQLRPERAHEPSAPPVRPGGIGLEVTVRPPPAIVRVTPERQAPGRAVRVDLALGGASLDQLTIGGAPVPTTALAGTSAVRAVLPAAARGAAIPLAVRTAAPPGLWSAALHLTLLPASAATVDAPAVDATSMASPLTLTGAGLADATAAMIWPDAGAPGDGDVRELALASATPGAVTIGGAAIAAAVTAAPGQRSLVGVPLRLVLRRATGAFTPYVLVRFVP